jgi:hypothetical protein
VKQAGRGAVAVALRRRIPNASAPATPRKIIMRAFLVTAGLLFLLGLSTQLLRHIYVGWLEPRASVLDKYKDKTEKDIVASESLDELLRQYEEAQTKHKEWEQGKTPAQKAKEAYLQESYKSKEELKEAIEAWENRSREISELHFFWWCGLFCVGLGLACFVRANQWLGVGAILVGFVEMLYWTSPTFRMLGGGVEFERLLVWKTVYTVLSLALLLALWVYFLRRTSRST